MVKLRPRQDLRGMHLLSMVKIFLDNTNFQLQANFLIVKLREISPQI
ncbi:MAG: hypothetical protein IJS69_05160 [Selenomonadaceae bacterium]|nr:hypothetical protein [Selenomonadaceae bacterium]